MLSNGSMCEKKKTKTSHPTISLQWNYKYIYKQGLNSDNGLLTSLIYFLNARANFPFTARCSLAHFQGDFPSPLTYTSVHLWISARFLISLVTYTKGRFFITVELTLQKLLVYLRTDIITDLTESYNNCAYRYTDT